MAEGRLNLSMGIPGDKDNGKSIRKIKPRQPRRDISLEVVIRSIKARSLSPDTENKVINMAKKYPHGALAHFRKNLNKIIHEVQKKS